MKNANLQIALLAVAFITLSVHSHTWALRNGRRLTDAQPEVLAAQLPAFQSARPASRTLVIVPQGTLFRVRTGELIDVDSTQAAARFCGALDDPIIVGGDVIVPRGADVILVAAKVEQGGRTKRSDLIELKVNSIGMNGCAYPVVTNVAETKSGGEGKKTTGKVLGGAGPGAIIGGIAGGGRDAGIGALAGGVGGTVVAASGEPHLRIPAETRLPDWKADSQPN
jgi:hypothetical protein